MCPLRLTWPHILKHFLITYYEIVDGHKTVFWMTLHDQLMVGIIN